MTFQFESLSGTTLMPCDGLEQNKIVRVGKNSAPVLNRLWTKVREILEQRRTPFALSNALARLYTLRFVQSVFAIKSLNLRKQNNFGPQFLQEGRPQLFYYSRLLARFTVHRFAKFC